MAGLAPSLVISLVIITVSTVPISRAFQWWSPSSESVLVGGLASLLCLPLTVRLFAGGSTSPPLLRLAMFFSPFMFASGIDLVLSLESDGLITNYMAFYLEGGEPYLATGYGTAISYWDGVIHYILYWAMLYTFSNGNANFRSIALYWFGTFFASMIVLIVGTISGPFQVYPPILLNVLYVFLPIFFLCWVLSTAKHHKTGAIRFSTSVSGFIAGNFFAVFFIAVSVIICLRGLVALGANREVINYYGSHIELPITHPHTYPKITMLMYMFYGIPFCIYSVYCLLTNRKTLALVDASMVYAGLAANAQVGYVGPYLLWAAKDTLTFTSTTEWFVFWLTNILMFVVPHAFAVYCHNCYPPSDKRKLK